MTRTKSVCPWRTCRCRRVSTPHRRLVRSQPPEARVLPTGGERHGIDLLGVPTKDGNLLARLYIEQQHGGIGAGDGEDGSVRREGEAASLGAWAVQMCCLLAGRHVPEMNPLVVAGAGECLAVGRKCQRRDHSAVTGHRETTLESLYLPDANCSVLRSGGEEFAIRRVDDGRENAAMSFQGARRLCRGDSSEEQDQECNGFPHHFPHVRFERTSRTSGESALGQRLGKHL